MSYYMSLSYGSCCMDHALSKIVYGSYEIYHIFISNIIYDESEAQILSLNLSRGQSLSTRPFEELIGLITRNLLFFFLA